MFHVLNIGNEILHLYLKMAPYLMLGLLFAGIFHVSFNKDLVVKHLGKNDFASVIKSTIFGIPLPLCSCAVIPTALSLRKRNASKGSTLSFLISTPQTGVDSIIATWGMMGPVFMVFRPIAALIMGISGGLLANRFLKGEDDLRVSKPVGCEHEKKECCHTASSRNTLTNKIKECFRFAGGEFIDDMSLSLVAGLVIAGVISYLVPQQFAGTMGKGIVGMLLVLAISIPMYVCATASIPVALVMLAKGISPGAAFVFLAAGPVTNAASLSMITSTLGKKFMGLYLAVICVGSVAMGFVLDLVFKYFSLDPLLISNNVKMTHGVSVFSLFMSAILFVLIVFSLVRKLKRRLPA